MKRLRFFAAVVLATLVLSSCDTVSRVIEEDNYVTDLTEDFELIVSATRSLNEIRTSWTSADAEATESYLDILDELSELYLSLKAHTPTASYTQRDSDIDSLCAEQITYISHERALVSYTASSRADAAYQSDIDEIIQSYETAYDEIEDNVTVIKTEHRNG